MISERNFENLELLKKTELEFEDQLYENVDGFISLRKIDTMQKIFIKEVQLKLR